MIYKKEIFLTPEEDLQIESYVTDENLLSIQMSDVKTPYERFFCIYLNKDTAEAFIETIKQQIKLLDDE